MIFYSIRYLWYTENVFLRRSTWNRKFTGIPAKVCYYDVRVFEKFPIKGGNMNSNELYQMYLVLTVFAIVLTVCFVGAWLLVKKERITTVLWGALTWFLFATVLESIPKVLLLRFSPWASQIMNSPVLLTIVGASFAGVFEETGRLVIFKTALKNRRNRETAISHGLGHGGFEAIFLFASALAQYAAYYGQSVSVNVATLGGTMVDALPAMVERVFAILLHVSLSILVFYAVKHARMGLFWLAMLLHTLFDVPAALYQVGQMNIVVTEVLIGFFSVVTIVLTLLLVYRKDTEVES